MNSTSFYADLPMLTDFNDIGRRKCYVPLPADWHVMTCDVRNSTLAVEAGHYKNVNTIGAAVITAMLNAAGTTEIPFIFEGDGATLCVPPELLNDARAALLQAQLVARTSFELDLRIATIPLTRIREAGFDVRVARYRVSDNYVQAMFTGGGMAYADRCMKDPNTAQLWSVDAGSIEPAGNFEGLECRWRDIPSRHGETVSLMARVLVADAEDADRVYGALIAKVRDIYGADAACHPVWPPNLAFSFSGSGLGNEVGVRAMERSPWGKWLYLMKIRGIVLLGWILVTLRIRTAAVDWGRYKTILAQNSDVKKFNDCFRQVLAGNVAQREALTAWLDQRFARQELVYGLHVANCAQLTCLVFDHAGRHLHFIDGAGGGLCFAAKALKARMATRTAAPA
jgi:hypothetical protein